MAIEKISQVTASNAKVVAGRFRPNRNYGTSSQSIAVDSVNFLKNKINTVAPDSKAAKQIKLMMHKLSKIAGIL